MQDLRSALVPVEPSPEDTGGRAVPEASRALCLSGGGYRAMLFHLGALWRLHQLGYLGRLARISSVSGGSIVSGVLGLRWSRIAAGGDEAFHNEIIEPVRALASTSIDWKAILLGLLLPGTIAGRIARYYARYLYGEATLQDLPSDGAGPRFVINASNLQSGALWRFSRPYMRDYRVGEVKNPTITLAQAVGASSAFPPVLSPALLALKGTEFTPGSGKDLQHEPYTTRVVLSDGGVYDNMGLETAWKRYRTVLVSDAGAKMNPVPRPRDNWLSSMIRVFALEDNQVRSLRKRQVIAAYQLPRADDDPVWHDGTYWGIRTDITHYQVANPLDCPHEQTLALAAVPTRLARLPSILQERLINWGYAVCDAAMRRWVTPEAPSPKDFPYPKARVG